MIHIVIPTTIDRRKRTMELIDSIHRNTTGIEYDIIAFENNLGGWVPAVYEALKDIDGFVWLLGSDCIVEKDALKILWDRFIDRFPEKDGVVEPYNELHGNTLCQHPLAHRDTILKYLDKRFVHWYSDTWFTIQANRDNKLMYVPEARIQHNHFTNGKAEKDATYEIVFNPDTIAKDRLLFEELNKI